ncbi:lysoplasmalogenase [Cellulomonas massiliensis]|uniref:lysoplasmalogenase n=1 Tax=Cellulomonas massiliensis TaxID=1465811 RepID=UPI00031B8BC6|nr:lysoplasmalogenase [Cellulomonas massiliensis]
MGRELSTAARCWAAAFVVVALVQVSAELAHADALARVTQWMVMPLLAAALATATRWPRGRRVTGALVALGFSWLGDLLPSFAGGSAFLTMVGCFLLAQVAYVVAFLPDVRRSVVHRRPAALVGYALALVLLVGLCAPHAGPLLVPVAVYGGVLTAMAVLSTGVSRLAGVGGAVFLLSDALIALDAFVPGWALPAQGFWVMSTYCLGQALLAAGVARRHAGERRAPRPPAVRAAAAGGLDNVVAFVPRPRSPLPTH